MRDLKCTCTYIAHVHVRTVHVHVLKTNVHIHVRPLQRKEQKSPKPLAMINQTSPASLSPSQTYEGEYVGDKKHGQGSYTWPSGARFSGHFEGDQKEGHGVFQSPEGEKFEVGVLPVHVYY